MNANNFNNLSLIQTSKQFEALSLKESLWHLESSSPLISALDPKLGNVIALNSLNNPEIIQIKSIAHAVKILKDRQRNWVNISTPLSGRASLIQIELPYFAPKLCKHLTPIPESPIGHWALINKNQLLCSTACSANTPHGIYNFEEDKTGPPSRAYLKLWELFLKIGKYPNKNSICLELGASPGGWTYVLSKIAKEVIAIDKSPLHDSIDRIKNVKFIKDDILKLKWESYLSKANWLFCDAALSPEKLLPIFKNILSTYPKISIVCTLKQKGNSICNDTLHACNIDGTFILCLSNNKHELTWAKIEEGAYTSIN